MPEDDQARREEAFAQARNELIGQQTSNAEAYDKALLTLSSAFLGISLVFIKNIVPIQDAESLWLLKLSWAGFILTIAIVIAGFIFAQRVIRNNLAAAESYYLERNQDARQISIDNEGQVDCINEIAGVIFILSIILTVSFVLMNMNAAG